VPFHTLRKHRRYSHLRVEGIEVTRIAGFFFLLIACFMSRFVSAQALPIRLTIDTSKREFAIPPDFAGLGFETRSVVANTYGVRGNFFSAANTQLITLFRNIGIKHIRVGGGTVDGSGRNEHCVTPIPTHEDIDNLFAFARATDVNVIYSFRLLNLASCNHAALAEEDAEAARYIWYRYHDRVKSFSIGNEPDVSEYHSRPGAILDPAIYETDSGVPGSAYPSYLADWRRFAAVIQKAVPEAKFSGPDTAVSSTSSFTPNPTKGRSWTEQFAQDLKNSGLLVEVLQHHYVWGNPGNTTAQEAIDDMLSAAWDDDTAVGKEPARNGGMAEFHPYPYVYDLILSPVLAAGVPYRMTEANDCLHGVNGASDSYAAALWALDFMHWWAAHGMAGVNFHNNPWLPTDTIVPDPNPCTAAGCGNYRASPKGYGVKAFDLGSHGFVEPIAISNPSGINLTAYAVGTDHDLYVTIINKTHTTTHDAIDASVEIQANGHESANASSITLDGDRPGDAASMTATLGGDVLTNDSPWRGIWTSLGPVKNGEAKVRVPSTEAVIVRFDWTP
jgi:hypothetical protein